MPVDTQAIVAWLEVFSATDRVPERLDVIERRENPSSTHWVIDAVFHDGRQRLFVKRHASRDLFSQERDALLLVAPLAENDREFGVPRMIGYNDDLACVALNWLEGHSVGSIFQAAVSRSASEEVMERAEGTAGRVGRWLRTLRGKTAAPPTDLPAEEMRPHFHKLIAMISEGGSWLLPDRLRSALIQKFESNLAGAEPDMNCLVHNDFWFGHVWLTGAQICVLDFGRARIGPAGRDAVQFYRRLHDMTVLNPFASGAARDQLKEAFVQGYGGLDFGRAINQVWLLWTRVEQLAGLADTVRRSRRVAVMDRLRMYGLARQLRIQVETLAPR